MLNDIWLQLICVKLRPLMACDTGGSGKTEFCSKFAQDNRQRLASLLLSNKLIFLLIIEKLLGRFLHQRKFQGGREAYLFGPCQVCRKRAY